MAQDPAYLATQQKERITQKLPRPVLNLFLVVIALLLLGLVSFSAYELLMQEKEDTVKFSSIEESSISGAPVVEDYLQEFPFFNNVGMHSVEFDMEKSSYVMSFTGVMHSVDLNNVQMIFPYDQIDDKQVELSYGSNVQYIYPEKTDNDLDLIRDKFSNLQGQIVIVEAVLLNKSGDLEIISLTPHRIPPGEVAGIIENYENTKYE